MSTVIGLFPKASDLPQGIRQIHKAGFSEEDFRILGNEIGVMEILSYEPTCVLTKYARLGAFTGIVICNIPTLVAVLCSYDLFGRSYPPGIETFIASALGGAGVGAILGLFACTVEFEKIKKFYTQGVRKGGKAILIQTDVKDRELVQNILRLAGSTDVQAIPELDDKDK
jgi:hypothetical protein